NKVSEDIIRHAATLDLYQFENAEFYDKMERARQQTTSRTVLLSLVLTQLQELISLISLGGGLVISSPWFILLLVLAVVPSLSGELHLNMRSDSMTRSWAQERTALDYLRHLATSNGSATEVTVFGPAGHLDRQLGSLAD